MLLSTSRFVDRIDRVAEAAMVGGLVAHAEQLELVGRLLVEQADGAGRLLVSDLAQRSQFVGGDERVSRRPQRVHARTARRLAERAAPIARAA